MEISFSQMCHHRLSEFTKYRSEGNQPEKQDKDVLSERSDESLKHLKKGLDPFKRYPEIFDKCLYYR